MYIAPRRPPSKKARTSQAKERRQRLKGRENGSLQGITGDGTLSNAQGVCSIPSYGSQTEDSETGKLM